ncbi:hypothetical protein [Streptomyces sp. NPDC004728]|uniref:hypothetical protein n=1 Tax=Streptomyces sp. NPDC004728 TaxID=3154289 RepID=UPI00339ED808
MVFFVVVFPGGRPEMPVIFTVHELERLACNAVELVKLSTGAADVISPMSTPRDQPHSAPRAQLADGAVTLADDVLVTTGHA